MRAGRTDVAFDRRRRLIDTARALFATRPYDEVTTSEIASTAGVAYGLIAHHFSNKRGLYRAVMSDIAAEIAAAQLTPPPPGATVAEALRHALRNHVSYVDGHAESFVALVRGHLGPDQEQRDAIEDLRWQGALRVLQAFGVGEPIEPLLRVAMLGWVSCLDELVIQRMSAQGVTKDAVVELAAAALITTFRSVYECKGVPYPPALADLIESFEAATIPAVTGIAQP